MRDLGGSKSIGESPATVNANPMLTLLRPAEFPKAPEYVDDEDGEESTVGKMPPSDSDEDE